MKARLNWFSKLFVVTSLVVVLFKIEFFPFSNYQMYSEAFLNQNTITYYRIKAVGPDNKDYPFSNRKYGLFHAEQPLIESLMRHRKQDPLSSEKILQQLSQHVQNRNPQIKGLRLYKISFDWNQYKQKRLDSGILKPDIKFELLHER